LEGIFDATKLNFSCLCQFSTTYRRLLQSLGMPRQLDFKIQQNYIGKLLHFVCKHNFSWLPSVELIFRGNFVAKLAPKELIFFHHYIKGAFHLVTQVDTNVILPFLSFNK